VHRLPFDKPGTWRRGNLHTHSTRTDGKRTPEEVVAAYREQGYDFISLTDHFLERYQFPIVDTRAFRTDDFTTIIGAELHGPALWNGEIWHIVAVGLPLDFPIPHPGETGPELAARAQAAGAFVGIAHPFWYNLTLEDALKVAPFADSVEIYNHTTRLDSDRADGWHIADQIAMATGKPLLAYAADDAHFKDRADFFGGWVHVKSEQNSPESLLAALKAGHFYSSTGPEIRDIRCDGDELVISSSPVEEVYLTGAGTKHKYLQRSSMTETRLPLEIFKGTWARVTVVDRAGQRAWSNPFDVE
jgi:predicted metal-dependent phosphoesterase TrpH